MKRAFSVLLMLLLISVMMTSLNIRLVKTSGTIYIRPDGSIDPPTAPIFSADNFTYVFADNIYDALVVQRSNTVIDGAGYLLEKSGGSGISFMYMSNVTIKNTIIRASSSGVAFSYSAYITVSNNSVSAYVNGIGSVCSSYNIISGNNITGFCDNGIELSSSTDHLIFNNNISNCECGIYLGFSSNNTISGNNVTESDQGIWLYRSPGNVLSGNNHLVGNEFNFGAYGTTVAHFVQNVNSSNTVDGKPIYYFVGEQNKSVPADAGYVALVNSVNITVENLDLRNNWQAILLINSSESRIANNNIVDSRRGIELYWSSNNTLSGNEIAESTQEGFYLLGSSLNILSENNITGNTWSGGGFFFDDSSSYNAVFRNNIENRHMGFRLEPDYNNFYENNLTNAAYGFYVTGAYNTFIKNTVKGVGLHSGGTCGFDFYFGASFNTVWANSMSSNDYGIRIITYGDYPSDNTFSSNNITNNNHGIFVSGCAEFYHNNVVNNTQQVYAKESVSIWDCDYPGGGNYWSDHTGSDLFCGPLQDELGSDGVWDSPRKIGVCNWDNYPLTSPWVEEFGILNVWPNYGADFQNISIAVVGGFANVTEVKLEKEGCIDIQGTNITLETSFLLDCQLNLGGRELGSWDLVVVHANGSILKLEDAFTIYDRHLSRVYPRALIDSSRAIVHLLGFGFSPSMSVELRGQSSNITAETVAVSSSEMVFAFFNLSDAQLGMYDLVAIWPDSFEEIYGCPIEVNELQEGALTAFPEFEIDGETTITYYVEVPESNDLFVTLQKTSLVGWGISWMGEMSLFHLGSEIASTSSSHDLILHIKNPEAGIYTVNITAQGLGTGILTAWKSLPEMPLQKWIVGTIHCSCGSIWYQLELPPNKDSMSLEAQAMGRWSHFDIYYEEFGSTNHWVSPQGTQTQIEITDPDPGTYIIEFTDSAILYDNDLWSLDQKRDILFRAETACSTEPLPNYIPTIRSISTNSAGNSGFVTLEIKGGWLDPNATVSLVRPGYDDIIAQDIWGNANGTTLTGLFDLSDKETGEWALVVTNPDGQNATAPSLFTIEESESLELWAEIVGGEKMRVGRSQTYVLRCGNPSSVDANNLLLWIDAPPQWQIQVDLPQSSELPENTQELTSCIWIPKLPAKTTSEFVLHVSSQEASEGEIKVGLANPVDTQGIRGGQWYPPNECPPVGSVVIRLSKGFGPGHVGIVVGDNWEVVDLVIDNWLTFSYKVNEPFDLRTKWHDGIGGEGMYLGAWKFPGWTREKGLQIAEYAKARKGETGSYWLVPIAGNTKNCITFVTECLKHALVDPKWWPITTPAYIYESLSGQFWPEFHWGLWVLAPSFWITVLLERSLLKDWFFRWTEYKRIKALSSTTPEDKYGPAGFDFPNTPDEELSRFIPPDHDLYYKVEFWNMENATAPACDVFVTDQLDTNLNWSRFRFDEIGFLNWTVKLEHCQYFDVYVDTRPEMDLIVKVEGTFDLNTGEASWVFRSLDPNTMETPDDPAAGFLPPITESGYEIGWVCFSVDPCANLPNGTRIENQAFVNFDGVGPYNPAPEAGPFVNTIAARNIAVTDVVPLKTIIGLGHHCPINVTVQNGGYLNETFDVTLYVDTTPIQTQQVIALQNGTATILTFTLNTTDFAKGNYTIKAVAGIVLGELDTIDNTLVDGWVIITIPGDVDGDFDVDIIDVVKITSIYGAKLGDLEFNPNSDIDGDGAITILDVVICTSHYGEKYP